MVDAAWFLLKLCDGRYYTREVCVMRKLTVGLLGAAALATTILLVRQQKQVETE